MTAIRYDIIPGRYHCSTRGAMIHPNGFPAGVLDAEGNPELKAHCERNLVKSPAECATPGRFLWNGLTYYASARTLQQIERKFPIDEVFTDRDLERKEAERAEALRRLMATEEWLENKVLMDSAQLFGSHRQHAFVQRIRAENPEIAHARMTRVTQKFLNEGLWIQNRDAVMVPGPQFPPDRLAEREKVREEDPRPGRRRRR